MSKPTSILGQNIVVLGAAESGVGAAMLAQKVGARVWVSDAGEIQEGYRKELERAGIDFEAGGHDLEKVLAADWIVKSPGIPGTAKVVVAAREKGIQVVSEIEFASWFTEAKIIAITGTNGKTTTTSLIYHLLRNQGLNVGLAGNIGDSFALQVAEKNFDWYVIEVSSFQLDDILYFRPHIALLLNITPDHLDRYEGSLEKYAAAKLRITENQTADDVFIYGSESEVLVEAMKSIQIKATKKAFSLKKTALSKAWMEGNELVLEQGFRFDFRATMLSGKHNQLNALAALLAAEEFLPKAGEGLATFRPVSHRMEPVAEFDGIVFINDSKATNVDSALYALDGVDRPIIWMAGGIDKGNDYEAVRHLIDEKVNAIVILGAYREYLDAAFPDILRVGAASMKEAVELAYQLAENGDAVLLSPACASFDLFRNYEDRGDQFRTCVENLKNELNPLSPKEKNL